MTIACQTVNVLATGNLNITSTPTGARIWLAPTGQTLEDQFVDTNISITGLAVGDYDIKLVKSGYYDWTGTATITADTTTYKSATLTLLTGSVHITSTPSGASVYIDGSPISSGITDIIITGLLPGPHTYQLTLSGYYDQPPTPASFTINPGETTTISETLTLVVGAIDISSIPTGASISIDGYDQGVVTQAIIGGLSPGLHSYTLTKTDFIPLTNTFTLIYDETITVSETLTPVFCPTLPRYSENTVTLKATPKDGIGPYYVIFRKDGLDIDSLRLGGESNPIINAPENVQITRIYTLDDADIAGAAGGTIDFSVFISDSCPSPIGPQSCIDTCTINIGCVAPVCNFVVT